MTACTSSCFNPPWIFISTAIHFHDTRGFVMCFRSNICNISSTCITKYMFFFFIFSNLLIFILCIMMNYLCMIYPCMRMRSCCLTVILTVAIITTVARFTLLSSCLCLCSCSLSCCLLSCFCFLVVGLSFIFFI